MSIDHLSPSQRDATGVRRGIVGAVIMTALIAFFFLLSEHWAHVAGYWPYLLLLACPLMHLFHGHGGHGGHHDQAATRPDTKDR